MTVTRRHFVTRVLPGAALGLVLRPAVASAGASFVHGVASGDPSPTGVLIWTRVTPSTDAEVEVAWQVARDPAFDERVLSGETSTSAARDYTVKVEVEGLDPGKDYFYRFDALGAVSQTGRTRTLPVGALDRFVLAVCSCSNYPAGYFNAYRLMAETDAIDAVLHLGDYIYEYDRQGYASEGARALHRESVPGHELVSLKDYRARHAQYRSDPDLQAAHARHPFIVVWDDHESANDSWTGGAENHDASQGDWSARLDASVQAYYEWMPIRESGGRDRTAIYRAFELGDLASLIMLETRLSARTEQAQVLDSMTYRSLDFDFSNPERPVALPGDRPASVDPSRIRSIPVPFDMREDPPRPLTDYRQLERLTPDTLPEGYTYLPDPERFRKEVLADPARRLMDDAQREFVAARLAASTAAGKPWQVIGNQALMAQVTAPNLAAELSAAEVEVLPEYIKPYVEFTRLGLPVSTDTWDGYDAERQWLCDRFRDTGASPVVVSGDSHAAWALDVLDPATQQRAAVEFGTTSISSPGYTEMLNMQAPRIERLFRAVNPNLYFSDVGHRGFLTLTLTPDGAEAAYNIVDTVMSRNYSVGVAATLGIEAERGKPPRWA